MSFKSLALFLMLMSESILRIAEGSYQHVSSSDFVEVASLLVGLLGCSPQEMPLTHLRGGKKDVY